MLAWTSALAVAVLSFVPPGLRPDTGAPHFLEHFAIYAVLGAAFAIGYNRKQGLLAILFAVFAGSIEAAQLIAPGRHARLGDFAVDALGAYAGLLAAVLTVRIRAIGLSEARTRQNANREATRTEAAD